MPRTSRGTSEKRSNTHLIRIHFIRRELRVISIIHFYKQWYPIKNNIFKPNPEILFPADMFIEDLMKYLDQPSCWVFKRCSILWSSPSKASRFQIMTIKSHRPIQCGRVYIEFINKKAGMMPTKSINTLAGTIKVATAKVLATDIVTSLLGWSLP